MKRILLFSTLAALILTSQALPMIRVMDIFAVEVLLNKEGIIHNVDFLEHAENVMVKEGITTYRSSSNDGVVVTLEPIRAGEGPGGLDVRLQIPVKEEVIPHVQSIAEIREAKIKDVGQDVLESMGYAVNSVGMGVIDPREEPVDGRPVDEEPLVFDGAVDKGEPEPGDEVDAVVAEPEGDTADERPPAKDDVIWTQTILLSKANVRWSIIQYDNADGSAVDFILNIANAETISNEVKKDFQEMAALYGFDVRVLSQLEENLSVMRSVSLAPDIDIRGDGFDFQSAMEAELKWLRANGIVMGITDRDIADISSISKPGMAGWNSRIVHWEGRWIPYYETRDPKLIRTLEGTEVSEVGVPEGAVDLAVTSVSPNSKSITKWGRVKSGR